MLSFGKTFKFNKLTQNRINLVHKNSCREPIDDYKNVSIPPMNAFWKRSGCFPKRKCHIDYRRNMILCKFDGTQPRCWECPFRFQEIIYYINPQIQQDKFAINLS